MNIIQLLRYEVTNICAKTVEVFLLIDSLTGDVIKSVGMEELAKNDASLKETNVRFGSTGGFACPSHNLHPSTGTSVAPRWFHCSVSTSPHAAVTEY